MTEMIPSGNSIEEQVYAENVEHLQDALTITKKDDGSLNGGGQKARIKYETRDALTEKIEELFHFCDVEKKGHVVRADLYRLRDELGLEFADIDNAFDQLDTNGDSFLSMEEFTTGFGLFVGVATPQSQYSTHDGYTAGADGNSEGIKLDFSFQVFNLIDKDDKGHITKQDLNDSADTLEIDSSQIDYVYQRLRGTASDKIYFEDFVNNIGSIVALSPALQEIKDAEERKEKEFERINTLER